MGSCGGQGKTGTVDRCGGHEGTGTVGSCEGLEAQWADMVDSRFLNFFNIFEISVQILKFYP